MGLDTSHDCWHGAYSTFMRWRKELAKAAGLPPLELMDTYYVSGNAYDPIRKGDFYDQVRENLPIRWKSLRHDPALYLLLQHSDCEGNLQVEWLLPLADRLTELLPLLDRDGGGHIGNYRVKTQAFIEGLRRAAELGEPVEFH